MSTRAELYRARASELRSNARNEKIEQIAREWRALANGYDRLAEQADRDSFQDIWFEHGPKRSHGDREGV
jgi:hypothetical protein